MTNARKFRLTGFEQMALPVLGRVYKSVPGTGKVAVVQADITSISRTIRRFQTNNLSYGAVTTIETGTSITVANAIFNALQTDSTWWKDSIGYNFSDAPPAAKFPGLGVYEIVYQFTPASAGLAIFPLVIEASIVSLEGALAEG